MNGSLILLAFVGVISLIGFSLWFIRFMYFRYVDVSDVRKEWREEVWELKRTIRSLEDGVEDYKQGVKDEIQTEMWGKFEEKFKDYVDRRHNDQIKEYTDKIESLRETARSLVQQLQTSKEEHYSFVQKSLVLSDPGIKMAALESSKES